MKTEGTGNKIVLIALLCAALGLFLYIRPRLFAPKPVPTLMDRLPESTIIGRYSLLDVARETNSMLFKQKMPFREYLTYDFLLSQGKNFGLDVQKPGYFFSDGRKEWGTFLAVIDSSKIQNGIMRLQQYFEVTDTLVYERRVQQIESVNISIYYDKSFVFIYHGKQLKRRLGKALFAEPNEIESSWKKFMALKTFADEKIVLYSESDKLKKYGVDYALFSHDSDSLNVKLKTYLHASRDLKVRMKDPGLAYQISPNSSKAMNIHLDISELRKDHNHPIYQFVSDFGRKISFPTDAFFDAWQGDLSFQEGGKELVKEEVIEMGYDEEFNPIELRTERAIPISGFSVIMAVNENGKDLVNKLFAKGIINKQGKKYRFLFSPPVTLSILPDKIMAFTSTQPKTVQGSTSNGVWNYKGTNIYFQLDSLNRHEVFGSFEFPVSRLLQRQGLKR